MTGPSIDSEEKMIREICNEYKCVDIDPETIFMEGMPVTVR